MTKPAVFFLFSLDPYCLNCMGVETYMLYDDEDDDDTTIVSETKSESDNADESVVFLT